MLVRQERWILAFGAGSLLAALAQGLALGGLLSGIPLGNPGSQVNLFTWATPLSVLTAVLLANGLCITWRQLPVV